MAPAALRALVDDDMTTAQSEFWELGDGACSENRLRPKEKKKRKKKKEKAHLEGTNAQPNYYQQ